MDLATDVEDKRGASPQHAASGADELIDIYNEHGDLIGKATNQLAHTLGLWHRTFHCWIMHRHDDGPWAGSWTVVLQRRGSGASTYSGYLDISVAGHYQAGEGIEGGLREFAEELGFEPAAEDLTLIARRTVSEAAPNNKVNREYQDVYLLRSTDSLEAYRPGYPEVSGVLECRLEDLDDLINERVPEIMSLTATSDGGPAASRWTTVTLDQFIPNAWSYHKALFSALRQISDPTADAMTPGRTTLADHSVWEVP
jgi:isopentenyldiphosphate isomerase